MLRRMCQRRMRHHLLLFLLLSLLLLLVLVLLLLFHHPRHPIPRRGSSSGVHPSGERKTLLLVGFEPVVLERSDRSHLGPDFDARQQERLFHPFASHYANLQAQ